MLKVAYRLLSLRTDCYLDSLFRFENVMGHHGSKENDAASSGHFQKQKSSSGLGGSKRKRDKKSLSSAVSVSSNDSSLIPAFVIESENDGKLHCKTSIKEEFASGL